MTVLACNSSFVPWQSLKSLRHYLGTLQESLACLSFVKSDAPTTHDLQAAAHLPWWLADILGARWANAPTPDSFGEAQSPSLLLHTSCGCACAEEIYADEADGEQHVLEELSLLLQIQVLMTRCLCTAG